MNKSGKDPVADCPSCATRIYLSRRPRLGDIIICRECEETLEVVRLTPLELDWALLDDDESWVDVDMEDHRDGYSRSGSYDWD